MKTTEELNDAIINGVNNEAIAGINECQRISNDIRSNWDGWETMTPADIQAMWNENTYEDEPLSLEVCKRIYHLLHL